MERCRCAALEWAAGSAKEQVRALVIGASGLVGGALIHSLTRLGIECVGTFFGHATGPRLQMDIRREDAIRQVFEAVEPTVVFVAVNTPGGVDYCEGNPDEAFAINVRGTGYVINAAARFHCKIVYYSTDYVFDGKVGPYSEEDPPGPISVYGKTKWQAEQEVLAADPVALTIRTTAVYGWAKGSRNFAMQIWERLSAGQPLKVPDDQWCNPTLAEYLADASVRLIEGSAYGLVNVVGKDRMPRSEMARSLASIMGLDPNLVIGVPTANLERKAPRPLQGGLKTALLERLLGTEAMGFQEALDRFKNMWRSDVEACA